MRLKEDKSNWKASNLLRKLEEPPEPAHYESHKNTKRWCKGKVGKPHDYYIVDFKKGASVLHFGRLGYLWMEWRCKNCGKKEYQGMVR